jgi:hypothetical protein
VCLRNDSDALTASACVGWLRFHSQAFFRWWRLLAMPISFRILPPPRNRHNPALPVPPHGNGSPQFGSFPQVDEGDGGGNIVDVA